MLCCGWKFGAAQARKTVSRYKWFSIAGECDPQESAAPTTKFQFGDGSSRDRVTLEAWRGDRRVAHSEIDVTLSQEQMRLAMKRESNVKIRITDVPPYDRYGGVDTRANIGGLVTGSFGPNCKVVVYTRVLDTWYIQPLEETQLPVSGSGSGPVDPLPAPVHCDFSSTGLFAPGKTNRSACSRRRCAGGTIVEGVKQ